jgi:hypothetical protein
MNSFVANCNVMKIGSDRFLWLEEVKLVEWLFTHHNQAFVWKDEERERFNKEYFYYGLSTRAYKLRILREVSLKGNLKDSQQGTLRVALINDNAKLVRRL